MRFTAEQRQLINGRINNYRAYDYKRFGTKKDSITYSEYLELIIEQEGKCYWTGRDMTITEGLPSDVSLDHLGRNDATVLEFTKWLYMMGILSPALEQELTETNTIHLVK